MSVPEASDPPTPSALRAPWEAAAAKLTDAFGRTVALGDVVTEQSSPEDVAATLDFPLAGSVTTFTGGITGDGLIGVSEEDARGLADLMMGGDGVNYSEEFGELQISAVAEALSQACDSIATALTEHTGEQVSVTCQEAAVGLLADQVDGLKEMAQGGGLVVVAADLSTEVDVETAPEGAVRMRVYHILPPSIIAALSDAGPVGAAEAAAVVADDDAEAAPSPGPELGDAPAGDDTSVDGASLAQEGVEAMLGDAVGESAEETPAETEPGAISSSGSRPMSQEELDALLGVGATPSPAAAVPATGLADGQEAQAARFEQLEGVAPASTDQGYDLVLDIPVQISVELGRAKMKIREVLDLGAGAIVELDKASGELVDILAGGRPIARGEVVVVDENFGVRVLQILRPPGSPQDADESSR